MKLLINFTYRLMALSDIKTFLLASMVTQGRSFLTTLTTFKLQTLVDTHVHTTIYAHT